MPAGGASAEPSRAQVGDERPALGAVRAVRRVQRKRGQVVLGRRGQRRLDEAVARAVRIAVQQLVLLQGQARVDVDQAGRRGATRGSAASRRE